MSIIAVPGTCLALCHDDHSHFSLAHSVGMLISYILRHSCRSVNASMGKLNKTWVQMSFLTVQINLWLTKVFVLKHVGKLCKLHYCPETVPKYSFPNSHFFHIVLWITYINPKWNVGAFKKKQIQHFYITLTSILQQAQWIPLYFRY